jgi:hypothetical protein
MSDGSSSSSSSDESSSPSEETSSSLDSAAAGVHEDFLGFWLSGTGSSHEFVSTTEVLFTDIDDSVYTHRFKRYDPYRNRATFDEDEEFVGVYEWVDGDTIVYNCYRKPNGYHSWGPDKLKRKRFQLSLEQLVSQLKIKPKGHSQIEVETCQICHESETEIGLPCGHGTCHQCLSTLLFKYSRETCPFCRQTMDLGELSRLS